MVDGEHKPRMLEALAYLRIVVDVNFVGKENDKIVVGHVVDKVMAVGMVVNAYGIVVEPIVEVKQEN